jgi:hypothetical protein
MGCQTHLISFHFLLPDHIPSNSRLKIGTVDIKALRKGFRLSLLEA